MARTLIGNFKGPKGDTGAQGATGPKGEQGIQGPVGPAGGVNSVNGAQGDVVVGGRNLFAISTSIPGYLDDAQPDGHESFSANGERLSDYIAVSEGDIFTIQSWTTCPQVDYAPWMISYAWYSDKSNDNRIGASNRKVGGKSPGFNYAKIEIGPAPSQAKYLRVDARLYKDGKIKVERATIATDWSPAPEDLAPLSEVEIAQQMYDRIYEGTDLTVKFASEIEASGGDPWAWIHGRIRAGNYGGIHVGDYIPITCTDTSKTVLHAEIAGIDTYRNYGSTVVGHHIDWICRELWPVLKSVNPVNYNNGISTQEFPWLASDLYHWLNSLSGSVPNAATVNPDLKEVDYTKDGVYYFLPENLKAVIVEKHFQLNKRYSASGLLTNDTGWGWKNIGKLWLPTEAEVYGMSVWGNKDLAVGGSALQYPIFANNMKRLKYHSGSRYYWWLLCPLDSNFTHWCNANSNGNASNNDASNADIAAPVCFRVA